MPGDFGDSTRGRYDGYGQVDPYAPSVSNGGITPDQWAEYQKKRHRAAILGLLGTVGGMAAAGPIAGLFGGGGSAAASAVPGAVGAEAAPLGVGSVVAGGALPSGVGAAAGGGAAAGAGAAAKGLLGGLSARDLAALGLSGASMIGSALSDKPDMTPTTQTTDPNLMKLIQTMQGRLDKSEPLYGSILDMANGLLPTQYQKGGGGRM